MGNLLKIRKFGRLIPNQYREIHNNWLFSSEITSLYGLIYSSYTGPKVSQLDSNLTDAFIVPIREIRQFSIQAGFPRI